MGLYFQSVARDLNGLYRALTTRNLECKAGLFSEPLPFLPCLPAFQLPPIGQDELWFSNDICLSLRLRTWAMASLEGHHGKLDTALDFLLRTLV